ncbi:MAG: hypothetical protein ACKE5M_05060 [Methylophilaceae bacterium]
MTRLSPTIKTTLIAISFCLLPSQAMAKDISNEQRNAYEARQQYNKNESNHRDLLKKISRQEKRVADEQARLNELQGEEVSAANKVNQSKVNLDAKVQKLNEVWDLRNQ